MDIVGYSLVPRPLQRAEEKGPGTHYIYMRPQKKLGELHITDYGSDDGLPWWTGESACNGYQALSPPLSKGPGYEDKLGRACDPINYFGFITFTGMERMRRSTATLRGLTVFLDTTLYERRKNNNNIEWVGLMAASKLTYAKGLQGWHAVTYAGD